MNRKLANLLTLIAAFLLWSPAWSAPEPLVFFGDTNLPPYQYLDKGEAKGASIDLANAIGRVLGRPVEVRLAQWDEAQARLIRGEGHALLLMARTPEREIRFDFTQETLPVYFSLFVRADETADLNPADLRGKRIGVTSGGLPQGYMRELHPDVPVVTVQDNLDGTRKLTRGEIDAFAVNTWSELHLLKELGITGIRSLPPFSERKSNIAVRKGDQATLADLDHALTQLKTNGEFDRIIDKWSSARVHLMTDFAVRMLMLAGAVVILALGLSCFVILRLRAQTEALSREVAERRRVETQLLNNQNSLELALDTAKLGMYDWDIVRGTLSWTKHHYRIFGFEPDSFTPTYDDFRSRVHPDDIARIERSFEAAKKAHIDFENDFRVILPGDRVRYITGRGRFLYDEAGKAIRSLGGVVDMSAAIEANAALARSERQFATLVENSPDIFARLDLSLRHLYVSPAIERLAGRPAADFIGKTNEELGMPAELCAYWTAEMQATIQTKDIRRVSFSYPAADDSIRVFESRIIPEEDSAGMIESLLIITADVTEREQMTRALQEREIQLRDADRRKDEFLATLAHELRNPLAPIQNAVQLMKLTGDRNIQRNSREIIERQLEQLVQLVDDLLDVNRINQGKLELRRQVFDLSAAVQNAVETSQPLIAQEGHTLAVDLPSERVFVNADLTRLTQIIANLLNNAAKYTHAGGQIRLSMAREGEHVVVKVKDNGIGIPPRLLPTVFDMFQQLDRGPDQVYGGLDIGLALVKRLVELHGGSVEAHSDGPGQGAEFSFRLPVAEGVDRASSAEPCTGDFGQAEKLMRVLVVDDNVDNAESLAALLELLGYRVAMAHEGASALELASAFRPNVVFLDIGLPGMSGHDVARCIRAQPGGDALFLVAVTGWGQAEDVKRSEESGFDRHVVKPVTFAALREILAEAVVV